MREISVSTEVFAAIWAARASGEESEDQILKRILLVENVGAAPSDEQVVGFVDLRSGTRFPAGFEIFRTYKGTDYRARAVGGVWVLENTGVGYTTLNQLSQGIGISSENAWRGWYFLGPKGKRQPIHALRRL